MQGAVKMEVRKKFSYVLLGFSALLIPFLATWQIVLITCAVTIYFAYLLSRKADMLGHVRMGFSFFILAMLALTLGFPLYLLSATIAIVAFGDGMATLVGMTRSTGHKTLRGSLAFLVFGSVFAFLFGSWILSWQLLPVIGYEFMFFLAVIGSVVGALVEVVSTETSDSLTVPLGSAMAMWLFSGLKYFVEPRYLLPTLLFTLSIGIASYKSGIADLSGVLSGTLLGLLIIVFADLRWFMILLGFLIIGSGFTKYKYAYKVSIGVAQSKGGARGVSNVFGNGLFALVFAVGYGVYGHEVFLYAFLGAISTATADTLGSEIGGTSKKLPVMITSFKQVPHGTDGGITLLGELACVLGAVSIGVLAVAMGMGSAQKVLLFSLIGGLAGTHMDSLLGATLENKYLTNATTNLAATFFGGLVSAILSFYF